MSQPVCVIPGAGPGNGAALARRFAQAGYAVAMLARSKERLEELAEGIDGAHAYGCDVGDPQDVTRVFKHIRAELGPVSALLYNAGSGQWGTVDQTTPETLEAAWRVNTLGLLACVRESLGDMREAGSGSIVVTGATASLRGGASFTAFASAKAAQRSLAQSMARQLWPEGIHVALAIVDGVVDTPRTREMLPDKPEDFFLQPGDIAESIYFLTQQPRSAWTFELDLRPYGETW